MIYINENWRIRRLNTYNIVNEKKCKTESGEYVWKIKGYHSRLKDAFADIYRNWLFSIPNGENRETLKECIERIERAEKRIMDMIGKADLPIEGEDDGRV